MVGVSTDEVMGGCPPVALAEANAREKVRRAVLPTDAPSGSFVLGADTIVVVDGVVLGKPVDEEDARVMLATLSGRRHEVITGVAVERRGTAVVDRAGRPGEAAGVSADGVVAGTTTTVVAFRPLASADLDAYLASGEWEGKAGSYAIQGLAAVFSEGIVGDYANVVGLPLALVAEIFRRQGFDLLRRAWLCPRGAHEV